MIYYLFQSTVFAALLYGFYHIALRNRGFYRLNRLFLFAILPLSLWLPTVQFDGYTLHKLGFLSDKTEAIIHPVSTLASSVILEDEMKAFGLSTDWINYLYIAGVLVFLILFVHTIYRLIQIYRQSQRVEIEGRIVFISEKAQPAFSFFHLVFLHPDYVLPGQNHEYIFSHESAHVRQLHSLDLVLVQLFRAVFWFHPLAYWIMKEVRLNHEFLADQSVYKYFNKKEYFKFLLGFKAEPQLLFANQFACHPLKRRVISASKRRGSIARAVLSFVLIVPVTGVFISAFSAASYKSSDITRTYIEKKNWEEPHIHVDPHVGVYSVHNGEYGTILKLENN